MRDIRWQISISTEAAVARRLAARHLLLTLRVEFFRGAIATVRKAAANQYLRDLTVTLQSKGSNVRLLAAAEPDDVLRSVTGALQIRRCRSFVDIKSEPREILDHAPDGFRDQASSVRVLDPEEKFAVVLSRQQPGKQH